ncbi:receptor-like protein 53 [Quercus suber]|uniref:Receptor-like protein 53 n=1 Tax=Quercus suber TaxID=58331 RepID=A0AAW0IQP0_QUESU
MACIILEELEAPRRHRSIPVSFGNLTKVTDIMLQDNNFTGQIPSSLSNLKYLNFIDLSYNKFEGSIPVSFGNLTRVTDIMLQYNNFTDQIPSSLSNLKDLTFIDFSHNNFGGFGGKIPFLTNLTKLTTVDLSYNQLTSEMQVCEIEIRAIIDGTTPLDFTRHGSSDFAQIQ